MSQKHKILIFSLGYYPKHIGGAEVAIKEITDRLDPEQYEFHLIANRYDSTLPKVEQINHVTVHRIGFTRHEPSMAELRTLPLHLNKVWYQWQAFRVAKRLHKQEGFTAIWAMMAHATGVPAALFKRRFPEVRYLLTLQEGDPPPLIEKKMRWFGRWFDRALTTAAQVQVISSFLSRWAKQKAFAREPILIPNAVTTEHFSRPIDTATRQRWREGWGVGAEATLLVTTSRLVHKNAVDDVIRALPLLPDKVQFIVYGTGPEEAMLKALATELGVARRVHFAGFIEHAKMPPALKAWDIFIRPSRSEGMGNSFIEAMAAELPVIATQEGGIADFLFDATRNPAQPATGWAVDANAPAQIAAAVQHIRDHPKAVAETVARAKAMAEAEYDWDLIATRMHEEIFQPLLADVDQVAPQRQQHQ